MVKQSECQLERRRSSSRFGWVSTSNACKRYSSQNKRLEQKSFSEGASSIQSDCNGTS